MQKFTTRLKIYNRENISEKLQLKLAEMLTTLFEIFALTRKIIKRDRILSFARNVVLTRDFDVKKALKKLNTLTKNENLLISVETHIEMTKQSRTINEIVIVILENQVEIKKRRMNNREIHNKLMTMLKKTQLMNYEKSSSREKVKKTLQSLIFSLDIYKRLTKNKVSKTEK